MSQLDLVLAWIFVASRYLHCYIRLSSNHVPHRAKVFKLGIISEIISIWRYDNLKSLSSFTIGFASAFEVIVYSDKLISSQCFKYSLPR